ncbi:gap junction protein alpha 9a [Cololabis saira]|uniref:gap junction protein alpha 9a n=1 Tax=Cololabis saira TaxID=129043 RepID=UPI002AD5793C|nr:gap junction protein alpha 9a [Cololabis saira]
MRNWNFLGGILEEVHIHSNMVGKIWLTILFIFRMLVLGVAAEDLWIDEQVDFICNTDQPGCRNVCYDLAFPISPIRYWVLQVIFVSSPSLVYVGHAVYRLRALEKARWRKKTLLRRELEDVDPAVARKRVEREMKQLDHVKLDKAPLRGALLRTYVAHIIIRSIVEVGFMAGQYLLYGFNIYPLFKCEQEPCPNAVDCYVSRPTEKTVFMMFMQSIAGLSLFLSILEVLHLGYRKIKKAFLDFFANDDCNVNKCQKESVLHTHGSASQNAKIRVEGRNMFSNPIKPAIPPLDVNDYRCSAPSPPEYNFSPAAVQSDLQCCDYAISSKQKLDTFFHPPHHRVQSPGSQKWPQKVVCPSFSSPIPGRGSRTLCRAHGSLKCPTALEDKSSDTDTNRGTKASSRSLSRQTQSKSIAQLQKGPSALELRSDSSSGSRCNARPASSNSKSSMGSSRRAPDLQI